jgi:hypothetical protein
MSSFPEQVKQLLATVAPTIGAALGGPLGGAAGTFLANALGVKPGDTAAVTTALTGASPETLLALKKADNEFQAHMADLGIEAEKIAAGDRASARQREAAVRDMTPAALAYLVTVGFFGVLGFLLVAGKPATGGDALLVMLGALGGAWASIIAYYFGSSSSSQRKDTLLWKSTPSGVSP